MKIEALVQLDLFEGPPPTRAELVADQASLQALYDALAAPTAARQLFSSAALRAAFTEGDLRAALQASGGDDYELCFTVAPAHAVRLRAVLAQSGTAATRIGHIVAGAGVHAVRADGSTWLAPRQGHVHFG